MKENQNIEWKEGWRDEYLKWICGFANAQGGLLQIGKDDHGVVTGLHNASVLLDTLPNKVRDLLGIMVDVNLHAEQDKEWLEIVVEPYPYPISYKGEYHYRCGSTKQELRGAALDKFLLQKQGKHWDGVPVPHVDVDDLHHKAFDEFRTKANRTRRINTHTLEESDSMLIEKLHLKEGAFLKRAAVLLFHPEPEQYVTGAYVKIGYFETDSELLFQDEIHGNLFQQVDQTLDLLLTKYLKAMVSYQGVQRVEEYSYPEAALREALLNAIAHKDYSSGNPIQISVYENNIIFWNSGQLPENWTLEHLQSKHPSHPFNPDIANTFFRAGLIEAWGRGIEKMRQSCLQRQLPPPVFKYEHAGFWVEFPYTPLTRQVKTETLGKTLGKTPEQILGLLRENAHYSIPELATHTGKSESAVERSIRKLREAGVLERVGPAKGGYWRIIE